MRILLIDDDHSIIHVLTAILAEHQYIVDVATDGEAGWELLETYAYDLVLLDIGLPKLDGISICRRLREQKNTVLVMLLTARDSTTDKLQGLDSGADDYVVKPFDVQELAARMRALLRRGTTTPVTVLTCGELQLDPTAREVTYAGRSLCLSRKEYLLLELFLQNQQQVFSRSAIVDRLWSVGEDAPVEDTVKSHVKSLRRKLSAVTTEEIIETLYGQGYRISPNYLKQHRQQAGTSAQSLDRAIAEIWQQTQGVCLKRLAIVQRASEALQTGLLDQELQQQAVQNAHKLAGSLGTFGFEQGSVLARQIEMLLTTSPLKPGALQPQQFLFQQVQPIVAALTQNLGRTSLAAPLSPPPSYLKARSQPLLLVVDGDRALTQSIQTQALAQGINVLLAADGKTARLQMQQRPDVALLDPALLRDAEGTALLTELSRVSVPIVMTSAQTSPVERQAAIAAGGHLFLPKPTTAAQALQAVMLLQRTATSKPLAQILAIDDDLVTLQLLKALLMQKGMHLAGLQNPTQLWETLQSVQPDLLILDMNMPGINGLEVCQTIRHDFHWHWLPIVFLTAQTDSNTLQQAFTAGADDFIAKPIVATELATRILNRLQRSRSYSTAAK